MQAQFPLYADNFPVWAEHSDAMHQYAVWTTLAAAGIGANLQHYNPLIDAAVARDGTSPPRGRCAPSWCSAASPQRRAKKPMPRWTTALKCTARKHPPHIEKGRLKTP